MLMTLISAIMGAALSALITVSCGLVTDFADIWIPILLFIGCTVGSAFLIIFVLFIATLFINTKKPVTKPSKVWFALYNMVNSFLIVWSGMDIKINEREKLGDGPYLFVVNHRSNFDPMIVSKVYKKYKPLMVSKPANFKIPIAGPAIHKSGFLLTPREDPKLALNTIAKAVGYLNQGEYSIGLCPEGTRNKHRRDLLPFKNGCLKIALRSGVPIVVLCLDGTEKVAKNFPFKRTKVYLDLIKVIKPEEIAGKHTAEVGEEIRNLMHDCIASHAPIEEEREEELSKNVA